MWRKSQIVERPIHLMLASCCVVLAVAGTASIFAAPGPWTPIAVLAAIVCGHVARSRPGMSTALVGCCLGYTGLFLVVYVPASSNSLSAGRAVTMMNNGRNIYVSLFAYSLRNPSNPAWPHTISPQKLSNGNHQFSDSTKYFRWVVTAGVMKVDWRFFSGPKMAPVTSQDSAAFSAENNAWCIVTGVNSNTPDGMPVLFTRNLGVTNLNQLTGRIRDTLVKRSPLKMREIVIVYTGGSSTMLRKQDLSQKWEDVLPSHKKRYGDHPVLRP
jgi:hypothetical protein